MREIRINGKKEFPGEFEGEALVSPMELEGFRNCDPTNGWTTERNHPLFKVPYEGKVLVYTCPRGSGGFMSYGRGKIPGAYVHYRGNWLSVTCAMCGHVPAVTDLEVDPTTVIETGDTVYVNGTEGYIIVKKKD